jgi:hypothetical protein
MSAWRRVHSRLLRLLGPAIRLGTARLQPAHLELRPGLYPDRRTAVSSASYAAMAASLNTSPVLPDYAKTPGTRAAAECWRIDHNGVTRVWRGCVRRIHTDYILHRMRSHFAPVG